MLRVCDLININYVPNEKEISLKLLVDFYEQYLCRRIFIFTLKNGEVVKLFFKDASEIYHISGIDHIYDGPTTLLRRICSVIMKTSFL